jgi:hypothetical protein
VGGTQFFVAGLEVHQVVKAVDQGPNWGLSANPLEWGVERGFVFNLHGLYFAGRGLPSWKYVRAL